MVIAIIGILATISVIALSNARAKSRDAKRAGDMKQVQTALELFFNDQNRYPTAEEWNTGQIYSTTTDSTTTYMQIIPTAPTPADGACLDRKNTFGYQQTDSGNSYTLSFCLGGNTGTLAAGPKCLTPGGIIDMDCTPFACGESFIDSRDDQSYNTVNINNHCWLANNLAYLPSVVSSDIIDDGIPYYYVFDYQGTDVVQAKPDSNYTNYGVLYNNPAAQTACPSGWHLPTDTEWTALTNYLSIDGQGGSGNFPDIGGKLKEAGTNHWETEFCDDGESPSAVCNSSGFTSRPGGYMDSSINTFRYSGVVTYLWSATENTSGNGYWFRFLYSTGSNIIRGSNG